MLVSFTYFFQDKNLFSHRILIHFPEKKKYDQSIPWTIKASQLHQLSLFIHYKPSGNSVWNYLCQGSKTICVWILFGFLFHLFETCEELI